MIFGLSKLLSVICYLLLPFFALTEKYRFRFISFTAPNIIPMILPQLQANKSIVLHLSALYSAIYDNHQDLYSIFGFVTNWYTGKCNKPWEKWSRAVGKVEQPIIFLRTFALRFKRESLIAQNIPSAHRRGQLLSKSPVNPH